MLLESNIIQIPMHLEIQFVDSSACEPIENLATDIWSCNSTGVYSGIDPDQAAGEGGLDSTFLRGVQVSDSEGVVEVRCSASLASSI